MKQIQERKATYLQQQLCHCSHHMRRLDRQKHRQKQVLALASRASPSSAAAVNRDKTWNTQAARRRYSLWHVKRNDSILGPIHPKKAILAPQAAQARKKPTNSRKEGRWPQKSLVSSPMQRRYFHLGNNKVRPANEKGKNRKFRALCRENPSTVAAMRTEMKLEVHKSKEASRTVPSPKV